MGVMDSGQREFNAEQDHPSLTPFPINVTLHIALAPDAGIGHKSPPAEAPIMNVTLLQDSWVWAMHCISAAEVKQTAGRPS